MFNSHRHEFDPLDREILERAFYAALAAIEENEPSVANEKLTATLRYKLIEIACTSDLSDAEALREIALSRLSDSER